MNDELNDLENIEAKYKDITNKLKKIESHKSTVSPEVYEKVKEEYESKLREAEAALAKNVDLIKGEVERLKSDEEDLTKKEKETHLKLEEIELRYSIGEYDDEKYTSLKSEIEENLGKITDDLGEKHSNLERLQGLIKVKEVEKPKEIEIEEHILEKEKPAAVKLDELLVEEEAVKPEVKEEEPTEAKKEKGVPCPKCGYLNSPDSWYCEKCGAEILGAP